MSDITESPQTAIVVLRHFVKALREERISTFSVDDLEGAIEAWVAKQAAT